MTTKKRTYTKKIKAVIPIPLEGYLAKEKTEDKELTIEGICKKNRFPFSSGSVAIGGFIADFINEDKRLIIEVEKEGRDPQERLNAFYKFRYKTLFVPRYFFGKPKAEAYITRMIKGFLR